MSKQYIQLEYNSDQGQFHFEDLGNDIKKNLGWSIVCKEISIENAMEFTNIIDILNKERINNPHIALNKYLWIDEIRWHFREFLLS